MFKNKFMGKLGIFVLFILVLAAGCVSDEENTQVIHENNLKEIDKYLADNPMTSVKEFNDTGTGIVMIWQEVSGSGISPASGDTLKIDYVGKLVSNSVFDTSIDSIARAHNVHNPNRTYEPLEFRFGIDPLIPGFEYGILQMELGDKATIIMPSLYGYASEERPGIPRNSVLVFEMDLVEINGQVAEIEE